MPHAGMIIIIIIIIIRLLLIILITIVIVIMIIIMIIIIVHTLPRPQVLRPSVDSCFSWACEAKTTGV